MDIDSIACDANLAYQIFVPCTGDGDVYEYDNSMATCEGITIPQAYHCAPTSTDQCQAINEVQGYCDNQCIINGDYKGPCDTTGESAGFCHSELSTSCVVSSEEKCSGGYTAISTPGDDLVKECNELDQCNWKPVEPVEPLYVTTDCGNLSEESCEDFYLDETAETYNGLQYPKNFYPVCAWNSHKCVRGDNGWSPIQSLMCYT